MYAGFPRETDPRNARSPRTLGILQGFCWQNSLYAPYTRNTSNEDYTGFPTGISSPAAPKHPNPQRSTHNPNLSNLYPKPETKNLKPFSSPVSCPFDSPVAGQYYASRYPYITIDPIYGQLSLYHTCNPKP